MRYAVSLSKIFKEQLAQIVEFDTLNNSKLITSGFYRLKI